MRLALQPKPIEGITGLDLIILEPDATVSDLAKAFDPFAGCHGGVYKRRFHAVAECRGCADSCCTTSIITPDPIAYARSAGALGLTPAELLDRHCDPAARAAGLVDLRSFPCAFLAPDGTCSTYLERSLICRMFICTAYTPELADLVHNILGAGLASLTERLHLDGLLPSPGEDYVPAAPDAEYAKEFNRFYSRWILRRLPPGEAMPPAWYDNPFAQARSYEDLLLRDFTTPEQWHTLTRGSLPYVNPIGLKAND